MKKTLSISRRLNVMPPIPVAKPIVAMPRLNGLKLGGMLKLLAAELSVREFRFGSRLARW